jgi:hypothetical protein
MVYAPLGTTKPVFSDQSGFWMLGSSISEQEDSFLFFCKKRRSKSIEIRPIPALGSCRPTPVSVGGGRMNI